MKRVFADTLYWIAITSARDQARSRALKFSREERPSLTVTTDEVLVEFLSYCASDAKLRMKAVAIVEAILTSGDTRVIPQSHASFLPGMELYRARPDKGYSLTDCISMQTMRREGIRDVLTNDRHFQQEGFQPVFRD